MGQQNNSPSQWPKAAVVIFGISAISAASYFLKEPNIMWAIIPLMWIVAHFD